MKRLFGLILLLLVWFPPLFVRVVDGISVTCHWSGQDTPALVGIGEIWPHDIKDSRVTAHTLLYADDSLPGRAPTLSPDGTKVAFVRLDGTIAIMSVDGGATEIVGSGVTTPQAFLDWPVPSWIYHAKGGLYQPTASRYLGRVNPSTGEDEPVFTLKKDDGVTDSGVWRFRVAGDLRHALVRVDDNKPEPFGRIVAMDLSEDDGVLRLDRAKDRFICSECLSPDFSMVLGEWIGGNQVLVDWKNEERIATSLDRGRSRSMPERRSRRRWANRYNLFGSAVRGGLPVSDAIVQWSVVDANCA